jgi:hypothetical protein
MVFPSWKAWETHICIPLEEFKWGWSARFVRWHFCLHLALPLFMNFSIELPVVPAVSVSRCYMVSVLCSVVWTLSGCHNMQIPGFLTLVSKACLELGQCRKWLSFSCRIICFNPEAGITEYTLMWIGWKACNTHKQILLPLFTNVIPFSFFSSVNACI